MIDTRTLPFGPPPYSLSDNGATFWPPESRFDTEEWPFVAEAWEKWEHDYERIRHRRWQHQLECLRCNARSDAGRTHHERRESPVDPIVWARRHQLERHPLILADGSLVISLGEPTGFRFTNPRWTWDGLGFADLWDGKPSGWRTVIDGRDPLRGTWESDTLELGTRVADHLWEPLIGVMDSAALAASAVQAHNGTIW